jgi:hypothetical protein
MKKTFCLGLLIFPLLGACSNFFQEKVAMRQVENPGSLSDLFISAEENVANLAAPTGLEVSQGLHPREIRLSWTGVKGAAAYQIERAVADPGDDGALLTDDDFAILKDNISVLSYGDGILTEPRYDSPEYDRRYYYRVRALNEEQELEPGPPSAAEAGSLFRPPRDMKADPAAGGGIQLSWAAVPQAVSYSVYRSDGAGLPRFLGGKAVTEAEKALSSFSFTDTNGITAGTDYFYTVSARNAEGVISLASAASLGFIPRQEEEDLAALSLSAGKGDSKDSIGIAWTAPPPKYGGTLSYEIYRSSSLDATPVRIADNITGLSYTDSTGLLPDRYYYYQARAVETSGNNVWKGPLPAASGGGFILRPPGGVEVSVKDVAQNTLKWKPAFNDKDSPISYSYNIYGKAVAETASADTPIVSISPSLDADGYLSCDVAPYSYYYVTTVNSGTESAPGEILSPVPLAPVLEDVSKAANVAGYGANAAGVYPVRITWKMPANPSGIEAFDVYRSGARDSGFRKINSSPVNINTESGGRYVYYDDNPQAAPGKIYYYRVLSLNGQRKGSYTALDTDAAHKEARTITTAGWGALTHARYFLEYNRSIKASHGHLTLMHKPGDLDKLGKEKGDGKEGGYVDYDAHTEGLGAEIFMHYVDYVEFYIEDNPGLGPYFKATGYTNTTVNMASKGWMWGIMECEGMYPGKVYYGEQEKGGKIEIVNGDAGGGVYGVEPADFFMEDVSWILGTY